MKSALLKGQPTTRRQFRYSFKEGLRTQGAPIGEDLVQSFQIHAPGHARMAQKGLHFRCKEQPAIRDRVEQGTHAETVTCEQKTPFSPIPDRESPLAVQLVNAIRAIFLIQVQNYFSIRTGSHPMATLQQLFPEFPIVEDLSVAYDPNGFVLIRNGLRTTN